tara:strand:+ start:9173 stop:9988 length:816 start_codon:yes stop_codon:yes gene_type:complete
MSVEKLQPRDSSAEVQPDVRKRIQEAIAELSEPIKNILEQLRSRIDDGDYKLIIGIDTSGRMPAIILGDIVKDVYKKKNLPPPKRIFLAGSRGLDSEEELKSPKSEVDAKADKILQYLRKIDPNKELSASRVLIVDDSSQTGGSLKPLAQALRRHGCDFDVAIISALTGNLGGVSGESLEYLSYQFGGEVFAGKKGGVPLVYLNSFPSGVEKDPKDLFSTRVKYDKQHDQPRINFARKEGQKLSQELISWYDQNIPVSAPEEDGEGRKKAA